MKNYKLVEHTADIRLMVEGTTLEELFSAAIEVMAEIVVPAFAKASAGRPLEYITVELESADTTSLLIDFMSDVLTYTHINNTVYFEVEFKELSETTLKAKVSGIKVDKFDEDIKAVTYHEAEVKKNDRGNYETVVVFDI